MPIPVTCPECQIHFLVGDEFAGRPGRCPECAAIIHVPGPDPAASDDPYRIRDRFDLPPEPEPPRRRERSDEWGREQRSDYDDRPRDRALEDRGRTFDPQARAARWEAVARGLRNLMVATVLITVSQVVASAFDLIEPIRPGQQNNFGPREQARLVGNGLFIVLSIVFWAMGRVGCGRVPYVPARRAALPGGIIAGLTGVFGVLAFVGLGGAILVMQQNQPLGALLLLTGFCSLFPLMIGFPVAEIMGLVSQMRMADGLRDPAFGRASRVQIVVALVLTGVVMIAGCAGLVFLAAETKKLEEKQRQEQLQQGNPAAKDDGPVVKGKGKAKAPNPQPGQQQQPPPEIDLGEYPGLWYAANIGWLLVVLAYATVSVLTIQLGRRAIRREVHRLVGDPHDRDVY
jgi:hypothetical protein